MSSAPHPASERDRRVSLWTGALFALIVAGGVWLRLHQITIQIIGDDEWHALNFLKRNTYADVFRHFGGSDHCIPLTLYYKLFADTMGISELAMRAPVLLFGIAALIAVPLLLRSLVGVRTSLGFAALLAISPLHVYFSRYARPYSAMFFFGVVGALAFDRWRSSGRRFWAVAYAACAILGPWFHPVLVPFSLAPLAFALVRPAAQGATFAARLRAILPIGVAIAIGQVALLGPPILADFGTIRERSGTHWFSGESSKNAYDLLSGSPSPLTGFLFGVACLAGVLSLARRRRSLLVYLLFLTVCQLAAIVVARPEGLADSIVAVRYALPVLAIVLLFAGEGLTFLDDLLRREWRRWPRPLLSVASCAALVAWGPLVPCFNRQNATYYTPNSFTNHTLYQYLYAQRARWDLASLILPRHFSEFYLQLGRTADAPGSETERIVEAPWYIGWAHMPFVLHQKIHKRPISIGFLHEPGAESGSDELPWPDPRFRFANFVHLGDYEGLRAQGVRYVVLHKDLAAEIPIGGDPMTVSIEPWVPRYTERFGPPCFEDETLVVFDVRPGP